MANVAWCRSLAFAIWMCILAVWFVAINTYLANAAKCRSSIFAFWMLLLTVLFSAILTFIAQIGLLLHLMLRHIVMSDLAILLLAIFAVFTKLIILTI